MEPGTLMGAGALLSGVGSLGSLFGGGSKSAIRAQENIAQQNLQMQELFARQGIRWRVEDAKKAGIHPLYALGASIPSYSPSTYIPGDGGARKDYGGALRGLGDSVSQYARSIDATRTPEEFVGARLQDLSITRAELENDLLRSQIARLNQSPTVGMPNSGAQVIPGQADIERNGLLIQPSSHHVATTPQEVTPNSPYSLSQEPMAVTDYGYLRTPTGFAPVPSSDAKKRIEDQVVQETAWSLRNNLLPSLGDRSNQPPAAWLPEGAYEWKFDPLKQEWQPSFRHPRDKPSVADYYSRQWPSHNKWYHTRRTIRGSRSEGNYW